MVNPLVNFTRAVKACGNCEFWEGARQVQEDGSCLCMANGCGFCLRKDSDDAALSILDTITESASNHDCVSWHPARAQPVFATAN